MRDSYLSRRVAGLRPSGIRKFFDITATMKDVISLGIGEPDFTTPECIIEAGIQSLRQGETHYTSNSGIQEVRNALAIHLDKHYGLKYNPNDEIVMTVGCSEALYLAATALLDPGDEVIIPTPCFVSYQAGVILAGGVAVEVASRYEDDFQPDIPAIEAAITSRTKAILVGYPSNPSGAVASRETLQQIVDLAVAHDLIIISDEIYDRLVYDVEHVSMPALPGAWDRTILLGGFSKDYAMTGWRIGYACAPAVLAQGMVRIHQYTIMSAPTTAQMGALEALRVCDEDVILMREEYDRRRKLIVAGLNEIGLPTFEPKGAFYAFPKVDVTGLDDETFANRLLQEERVAIVPGSAFGPGGEGFCRASYATAYEQIEAALERIQRFVNRL